MQLNFSLSIVGGHRMQSSLCIARSSPSRLCLTIAARKPARPGRPVIGEGPRCEVPPHTKGVASDRSAGWERSKAARPLQSKAPTLPLHHLQTLAPSHLTRAALLSWVHTRTVQCNGRPAHPPSVSSLNHVSFPRSSSSSASAPGRCWRVRGCPRSFTSGESAWI